MKHILIILSLLLLSSPLFGQSTPKYESVGQCVLQTMTEKKLTGNEMFEVVKEECERILEKVKGKGKKRQNGVLFFINRNRIVGWYEDGDEEKDGKYVGEIEYRKPNGEGNFTYRGIFLYGGEWKDGMRSGLGTQTYPDGGKYEGSWKNGVRWNGTSYDKNGNILEK